MGDFPVIPPPPDFPPTKYSDETPPPPVIEVDTTELERPTQDFGFPQSTLDQLYRWTYWFHRDHLAPASIAHQAAAHTTSGAVGLAYWAQMASVLLNSVVAFLAGSILKTLEVVRKALDPAFGILSTMVLSELLGTDFTADHLPMDTDVASHIARAGEIGSLLTTQLETEFVTGTTVTPASGQAAANKFTGFAINFSVANGILAVLGGLVPMVHLDEIREIGEEVAQNIGLGRLVRGALRPLVQVLVTQPYTWYLNQKYHATQFKEGDLINPYTSAVMDHETLFNAMDLLGYSVDKINALIALHAKKLTVSDVETLVRYGSWTYPQGLAYVTKLGYSDSDARGALFAIDANKADAWVAKLVDAIMAEYTAGNITQAEFSQVLATVPLSDNQRQIILALSTYAQAKHVGKPKHLPAGEMVQAFENGLIDLGELTTFYQSLGYTDDMVSIAIQLALLKTKELEDKEKAKAARQAAAAAKAAAKANPPATPPNPTSGTSSS